MMTFEILNFIVLVNCAATIELWRTMDNSKRRNRPMAFNVATERRP
jgi:hypothetical protein